MAEGLYVGAISGTSMDGIDVVLVDIRRDAINTVAHHSLPYPATLKKELIGLCTPGENEIQRAGEADVSVGRLISKAVNELIQKTNFNAKNILAIGSHGQTIRHSVDSETPFTLQIGNPNIIAHQTEITTVADFRMADIAAEGQGAPLAPALHAEIFKTNVSCAVINLGGIANITLINPGKETIGYDTGTSNTLMDQWIQKYQAKEYDTNGDWARTGSVIPTLLNAMLEDPYFLAPPPKSTGREYFHLGWLQPHLDKLPNYDPEDVQRTLLEFTAVTVANEVNRSTNQCVDIYLCGGGVFNALLVERLSALLPKHSLKKTDDIGIHTQQVEATAFAWLAYRTLTNLTGNLPSVTGACRAKILGGIYPAS